MSKIYIAGIMVENISKIVNNCYLSAIRENHACEERTDELIDLESRK
jgi:hypothetical protein